jgi:hypothetical protein
MPLILKPTAGSFLIQLNLLHTPKHPPKVHFNVILHPLRPFSKRFPHTKKVKDIPVTGCGGL